MNRDRALKTQRQITWPHNNLPWMGPWSLMIRWKCLISTNNWLGKMCVLCYDYLWEHSPSAPTVDIHTPKYRHAMTQINCEGIMLSEISQMWKGEMLYESNCMKYLELSKRKILKKSVDVWAWAKRWIGYPCLMVMEFQFGKIKSSADELVTMVVQCRESTWCHWAAQLKMLKMAHSVLYIPYHNVFKLWFEHKVFCIYWPKCYRAKKQNCVKWLIKWNNRMATLPDRVKLQKTVGNTQCSKLQSISFSSFDFLTQVFQYIFNLQNTPNIY